ncbi:MAG: hypothetical protein DHS20C09_02300 [marine bacterium B5-7]|nr:MAG: hypothetical protein DHS20C09_02300 [marine bacterium B5-7]
MNPTSATDILASIKTTENSVLPASGVEGTGVSGDAFSDELTKAIQEAFTGNGNTKPLDIAGLKNLDTQQLTDLAEQMGIQLSPELLTDSVDLKQSLLNTLALEINSASLTANPNASEILKTAIANPGSLKDGMAESGLSGSLAKEADWLSKFTPDDVLQQAAIKKEAGLANARTVAHSDATQFINELSIKEADISRDLIMQAGRQDSSTIKLADQFISIDKPTNVINSISNPTIAVQQQSSNGSPVMMLSRVDVPVQQAGWGEAVGNRLMMMVNDKIQTANIHLNPAELGPIEVKVSVNQEHASVQFVSNNAVVRDAIEDAFPRLKEMFLQNGLSLSDANVSQQSSQQSNSYSKDGSESQLISDSDSLIADESQAENKQLNMVNTGFVDHYV